MSQETFSASSLLYLKAINQSMIFIKGNILSFPTPFNLHFLGKLGNKIVLSDIKGTLEVQLSSKYSHLVTYSLLKEFAIVTVNEVKRISQFQLFVDNITIAKELQINCKLGNPSPFSFPSHQLFTTVIYFIIITLSLNNTTVICFMILQKYIFFVIASEIYCFYL